VDKHVYIWEDLSNLNTGRPTQSLRAHDKTVLCVAFAPGDSSQLATGGSDRSVYWLYRVASADAKKTPPWHVGLRLKGHGDAVLTLAFRPHGKTLVSGSYDAKIILWDIDSPPALEAHSDAIQGLAWRPDGKLLASAGYDQSVNLWDPASRKLLKSLKQHTGKVQSVAFSADGQWLASGSREDARVLVWRVDGAIADMPAKTITTTLANVQTVCFHPHDANLLAVAGSTAKGDYLLQVWQIDPKPGVAQPTCQRDVKDTIWSLAFRPDGKLLAAASWDASVTLWSVDGNQLEAKGLPLNAQKGRAWGVAFDPTGQWLASTHSDSAVVLWDLGGDVPVLKYSLSGHTSAVEGIAFSPNGAWLASAGWDGIVILWDAAALQGKSPQKPRPFLPALTGHRHEVWCVAFDPAKGSLQLASAGKDARVLLWDLVNLPRADLPGPGTPKDYFWTGLMGPLLGLGQPFGILEVPDMPDLLRPPASTQLEDWKKLAREVVNRSLSGAEYDLYIRKANGN
jgi:WD40 repeat protein